MLEASRAGFPAGPPGGRGAGFECAQHPAGPRRTTRLPAPRGSARHQAGDRARAGAEDGSETSGYEPGVQAES